MSNFSTLVCVLPLTIGEPRQFRQVRQFLIDSHYSEPLVCKRLGLKNSEDYLTLRPNPSAPHEIEDRLDLVARLFLIGEIVSEAEMRPWLPEPVLSAMSSLGVAKRYPGRPEVWYATVALYPVRGLHIVSDRWSSPELAPIEAAVDVVYPAITVNTAHFLDSLPVDPCDAFLDLCSGSGIAALMAASQYARQAWSTDITVAAAHCAEFNRMLNGIENATIARGDLFDAVSGRTFDRIVANPPYMPSLKPAQVYAYGGELGDQMTRRIIEGLPAYLRPGGRFYCVTAGPDIEGLPFEARLRSWLGASGAQFDIFLFERRLIETADIGLQQAARTRGGPEEIEAWKKLFARERVEQMFYGSVLVERHKGDARPVTVRRRKGAQLGTAQMEWLRVWETAAARPEMLERLLDSRPVAAPGFELQVTHRLRDGELAPEQFTLQTRYPFDVECQIQPWAAFLIGKCDGKATARELLGFLKENELVAKDESEDQFAAFLRVLISGGFLEIDGFRVPRGPVVQFEGLTA